MTRISVQGGAEERLRNLNIRLPSIPSPIGKFELGVLENGLLVLSGQGPVLEDGRLARGKVGADVTPREAYDHARRTGLVLIGVMRTILGSLDYVERIVKIFGMVNAVPEFEDHPVIIDGCSDLMLEVFGDRGRHARCAIGVGSLPENVSVEIEATVLVTADFGKRK